MFFFTRSQKGVFDLVFKMFWLDCIELKSSIREKKSQAFLSFACHCVERHHHKFQTLFQKKKQTWVNILPGGRTHAFCSSSLRGKRVRRGIEMSLQTCSVSTAPPSAKRRLLCFCTHCQVKAKGPKQLLEVVCGQCLTPQNKTLTLSVHSSDAVTA